MSVRSTLNEALRFFGFEFDWNEKSSAPVTQDLNPTGTALSPVPRENDGALTVQFTTGAGFFGYTVDFDGTVIDDFQLINRYRDMQLVPEVDEAIDQIINEVIIQDSGRLPVSLNLDYVSSLDEKLKIRLQAEFDSILKQLNFHRDAYSVMRQWYVDGRIFFYLIVDQQHPENGIQEIRPVDPRCIKKTREVQRKRHQETQADIIEIVREYFWYNPNGWLAPASATNGMSGGGYSQPGGTMQYSGIRLTADSVAYCPSGLYDTNRRTVLSWLHKAIKPLNLLRMIEDSCVIYRLARAPERRVFYIDVGNLPKQKAEQYLIDIQQRYKNKLVYDVSTGEVRDDRKFMSIMEDFWLPRKEGGKSTEISTLPAGQNLSEMEDVLYFHRKLYRALNLPPSRIEQGTGFSLGRASEISRDELRFNKFIHRLQNQFNFLFDQILERQLRLKRVMTEQDWNRIKDDVRYTWQTDSHFEELKSGEIWQNRLNLLTQMDPFTNKYFSDKYIMREVLKFTEEEMLAIQEDFQEADTAGMPFGEEGAEGDEDNPAMAGKPDMPFGQKKKAPFGKKSALGDEELDDEADALLGKGDKEDDDEEKDDDGFKKPSKLKKKKPLAKKGKPDKKPVPAKKPAKDDDN